MISSDLKLPDDGGVAPEVMVEGDGGGRGGADLGEQDRDGAGGRDDVGGGAGAAGPAVAAGDQPGAGGGRRVDVDGSAEAPALPVEEQTGRGALGVGEVVGHHLPNGAGGQ